MLIFTKFKTKLPLAVNPALVTYVEPDAVEGGTKLNFGRDRWAKVDETFEEVMAAFGSVPAQCATRSVVEFSDSLRANEYIQVGWTLLTTFVKDYGHPRIANQTMHYVLGWCHTGEPRLPYGEDQLQKQIAAELATPPTS